MDKCKFQQILRNIVCNALEVTHYGHISVTCTYKEPSEKLICVVRDSGDCIPLKNQQDIFKRNINMSFKSEGDDRPNDKVGIGLWLSKQLALNLNGKIKYCCNQHLGSIFKFSLQAKHDRDFNVEDISINFSECQSVGRAIQPKSVKQSNSAQLPIQTISDTEIDDEACFVDE